MDWDNRANISLHSLSKGVLALSIEGKLFTKNKNCYFYHQIHTGSFLAMDVFCYTQPCKLFLIQWPFRFFDRDTRKRDQTKYQIHMCCNLLAVYIVFLFGIEEVNDYGWCTFLAALLHYTLLTTWLWMGVYANKLYLVFSKVGLLLRQTVIRCFFHFDWIVGELR